MFVDSDYIWLKTFISFCVYNLFSVGLQARDPSVHAAILAHLNQKYGSGSGPDPSSAEKNKPVSPARVLLTWCSEEVLIGSFWRTPGEPTVGMFPVEVKSSYRSFSFSRIKRVQKIKMYRSQPQTSPKTCLKSTTLTLRSTCRFLTQVKLPDGSVLAQTRGVRQ